MALPVSRNTTYAIGSQVKSADLNALQDFIIAHETRLDADEAEIADHETRLDVLEAEVVQLHANAGIDQGADWTRHSAYVEATVAAPSLWEFPLPVKEGYLLSIAVRVKHSVGSAAAMVAVLWRAAGGGTPTQVASVDSAATTAEQTISVVTGHAVATNEQYWLAISNTSGVMTRDIYRCTVAQTPA